MSDEARMIAEGLLFDAAVSYVAMCRAREIVSSPREIVQDFGAACVDAARTVASVVAQSFLRHSGLAAALACAAPSDTPFDESIETEIQERVRMFRRVQNE